jgi:hypothetical protein
MEGEEPRRRRRLSAGDEWQIFIEASAKDAKVADVLRRWRIDSSLLARIRSQVKKARSRSSRRVRDEGLPEGSLEGRSVPPRGRLQVSFDREHPARKKIRLG